MGQQTTCDEYGLQDLGKRAPKLFTQELDEAGTDEGHTEERP